MNNKFLNDPLVGNSIKLFLLLLAIYLAIIVAKWSWLPPEIPLFYSQPRSTEQLGTSIQLLILPILSLLVFLGHFFLASFVYLQEKLLAKILLVESLISSSVFLITFAKIVFLIS